MKKKWSEKKFKHFSKLLFNINFHPNHCLRNSKTFDKKENKNKKKQYSFSYLIEPEIEYVSKLNFYNPENEEQKANIIPYNLKTMPNFKGKYKNLNIRTFLEEHKFQSNEEKYANQIKENRLENKRKDLEIKINKLKELINSLNEEIKNIIYESENLKLDYEALQNNKIIIEKNFKKQIMVKELSHNKTIRNSLPFLLNKGLNSKNNKENRIKIDSMLLKHKEEMKSKKNLVVLKIKQLNEQKKDIQEKIKLCENDLNEFKEERNKIKNELLLHYHKLLYEGKDTRKAGLSWIINAIWNLKSNVLLSYLPKFLDEESISFLFSYSLKKMKMNSIYKVIKDLSYKAQEIEEDNEKRRVSKEKTIDEESNTIDNNKNLFDFNGYDTISKENSNHEENKEEHNTINVDNFSRRNNKEVMKGLTKTNSFIFNEDKKINLFNRPKEIINELNQKNKKKQFLFTRNDTFRTSLYNITNNTDIYMRKKKKTEFQEEKKKNFFEYLNEIDENKIKNCIFNRKIFKEYSLYNKENKIKLTDFENIYNNKNNNNKNEYNKELLELYNARKEAEKNYIKLKNDIENMIKKELDRLNKCFYKENYEAKYNIDQNSLILAIIGEENSRSEIYRLIKERKKYFHTLKELRKGKI